ncbi:hypothetical protein AQ745_09235 [Burkholderia pseudomallei]|nr:hypothetical protein AQ744_18760 [Burkholderia pseudomallei]OMS70586.1 hypothetical protein AQ745_09235 [Burkholderia pseudomallei]OMS91541.1 hypothetical protein AQ747_23085 [Burkholderia pseudomallei]
MLGRDADRDASSRRAARRLREMLRESAGPGPDANRRRPAGTGWRRDRPRRRARRTTDQCAATGDRRPATGAPGSPGSTGSTAGAKAAARRPAAFDR